MARTPIGAFIRPNRQGAVEGWLIDDAPDLGVAGPPVGAAADILNRGNFPNRGDRIEGEPARIAGIGDMPHIPGHLVGDAGGHQLEYLPLPPPPPLPIQDLPGGAAPRGNQFLDAPAEVPAGPRGDRFKTLQEQFGIGNLQVGQVPMAEADFNLRRRLDAERRREEGLGVLQDALNNIGSSEGEIAAREVALQRLRGGGLGAGALRGQLAASQESALRQQAEQFAQRGLGGGVPAVAMMQAQRMGAIGAAGTEAAFRENLQRSALQDINAMNQEIGARRLAAQDLLQRYLGEWELPPIDLSGLAIVPEDAQKPIGGELRTDYDVEGQGRNLDDPNTWREAEDGGLVVPEGHDFAGCRLVENVISPTNSMWQYICPADHPRSGRHGAPSPPMR